MRDEPARDAVKRGLLDTFRGAWTDSEYEATFGPAADAVLAALGIPPDTTTDDVRAGLAALRILADGIDRYATTPLRLVKCEGGYQAYRPVYHGECGTPGASPAAAVNALAARLESPDA